MTGLVIGASGLVGMALTSALRSAGWDVEGYGLSQAASLPALDIRDVSRVNEVVAKVRPDVLFLAAAAAGVDRCEKEPDSTAQVNVGGTRNVVEALRENGGLLVWYSSDYVFDGVAGPYDETASPRPISEYGRQKLEAESIIRSSGVDHLIIRTTWVYDWNRTSKNFAMQVWQNLSTGNEMKVANDQVSTPTLAEYLAETSVRLAELGVRGIINVVGSDRLSRDNFARRLAKTMALSVDRIVGVPTDEQELSAARPLNAGLSTTLLAETLGTQPLDLNESLRRVRRRWRADTYVGHGPVPRSGSNEDHKSAILDSVRAYHAAEHKKEPFVPFVSRIPYSGRVYGAEEIVNLVDASLDFWLTLGPWGDVFERRMRDRLGSNDVVLVNSGSSANLTAVAALMASPRGGGLNAGDEVITPAVTFPTTIAPLLQSGLVPVVVDCELGTYNINTELIEGALTDRTRALFIPHTLGAPADLDRLTEIAGKYNLLLVEDMCDALGSKWRGRSVGTFGELATISFYPAHHITMGEGGAVVVNRPGWARTVRSIRDWGRDCWCAPGESNTCGLRFGWCWDKLPDGYDHKYTYSSLGYNLKPTDLQAAIGVAQLDRLDDFCAARKRNFHRLYSALQALDEWLILPTLDPRADPSWFAMPLTVREKGVRRALVHALENANIETRELFGGNILRQPAFRDVRIDVRSSLENSDKVAEDSFFVGVYPGLTDAMIDFMVEQFEAFFAHTPRPSMV